VNLSFEGANMDKSTQVKRLAYEQNAAASPSQRRTFLKFLGGSVLGATALAGSIGRIEGAEAFKPLWNSAQVFIGNSPEDQVPSFFIKCPMFFDNGHFAHAFHTLDLTHAPSSVRGTMTFQDDTIEPNFSSSVVAANNQGSDGINYLLVGGEGTVTGGTGYFRGVTNAIIRCKYKVTAQNPYALIACVDCVIVIIRNQTSPV
jgi:hypothetical protein